MTMAATAAAATPAAAIADRPITIAPGARRFKSLDALAIVARSILTRDGSGGPIAPDGSLPPGFSRTDVEKAAVIPDPLRFLAKPENDRGRRGAGAARCQPWLTIARINPRPRPSDYRHR